MDVDWVWNDHPCIQSHLTSSTAETFKFVPGLIPGLLPGVSRRLTSHTKNTNFTGVQNFCGGHQGCFLLCPGTAKPGTVPEADAVLRLVCSIGDPSHQ